MPPAEVQRRLSARWARHLERYGRRAPHVTDLYPRPRNKGMRADSWPEGGVPGSDYELLREQLLDEHDVDFGVLLCLNGQDSGYDPPGLAADFNRALNDWLVEEWLDRDDRLRSSICVPHDHPELAVAEIERRAEDPRFVQVLFPAGGQEPFGSRKYWPIYEAAADARPARRVPHRRLHGAPRHRLAVVLPRGARGLRRRHADAAHEPGLRGRVRGDPGPQGRAHRGRRAVGRGAALAAGRGVVAAARRDPGAGPAAVGVHRRARLVRHPADGGARRSGALPAGGRARAARGPADVRHRLPALGLRLAGAGAAARDVEGAAREACCTAPPATSTACRGSAMSVRRDPDAIDCDVHVRAGVDGRPDRLPRRLLALVHRRRDDPDRRPLLPGGRGDDGRAGAVARTTSSRRGSSATACAAPC